MSITKYSAPVDHYMRDRPYARIARDAFIPNTSLSLDSASVAASFGVSENNVLFVEDIYGDPIAIVRNARLFPRGPVRGGEPRKLDGVPFFAGSTIISAPSDVGKTPLSMYICDSFNGGLVEWGEPFPGFLSEQDELGMQICSALRNHKVVVVDSLKDLARNAGGTTMSDGLSSFFFTLMSAWSGHYASYGCTVCAPVNFSTMKDSAVLSGLEALKGNTTSVVWTEGKDSDWQWKARPDVGIQRDEGTFRILWKTPAEGPGVRKLSVTSQTREEKPTEDYGYSMTAYVRKDVDTLRRALSRQLKNHSTN